MIADFCELDCCIIFESNIPFAKICVQRFNNKKAQQKQVDPHRQDQVGFSPPRAPLDAAADVQAKNIVKGGGKKHQHHIDRLAPGVEEQAGQQQHDVFKGLGDEKISHQRDGQKEE